MWAKEVANWKLKDVNNNWSVMDESLKRMLKDWFSHEDKKQLLAQKNAEATEVIYDDIKMDLVDIIIEQLISDFNSKKGEFTIEYETTGKNLPVQTIEFNSESRIFDTKTFVEIYNASFFKTNLSISAKLILRRMKERNLIKMK